MPEGLVNGDDFDEDEYDDDAADDDDEESEPTVDDTPRPAAAAAAEKPVARRKPPTIRTSVPVVFGRVPVGANLWGIRRLTAAGVWETLTNPTPDGTLASREWPLDQLLIETVRERWGPGRYQVAWFGTGLRGGLSQLGMGRRFEILGPHAPAPVAAAPVQPTSGLPPLLQETFALMAVLDQQTNQKIETLTRLAQRGGGNDMQVIGMMLQQQQQNFLMALEKQQASTQQMIASLERRMNEWDTEEEPPRQAAPSVAMVVPTKLPRDAGLWDMAKAYFMSNPEKAFELLSGIPAVVATVTTELAKRGAIPAPPVPAPQPPQAAPAVVVARPRANVVPIKPSMPGLNTFVGESPPPTPTPTPTPTSVPA